MLVLSRRGQETVVINGNIRITIIRTTSNSVRLGIEAPSHVSVHRGEVHERIEAKTPHPPERREPRGLPTAKPTGHAALSERKGADAA